MEHAMRAVIDSDVLIDYLQGSTAAQRELDKYPKREISILSWMEIMTGADTPAEIEAARDFLSTCVVHSVSVNIAEHAVKLRREFRIRLPDAIIWATAKANECLLVTRNIKDFPEKDPSVRVPYRNP
jgi:predicted nucleic acid-binding protein